jgi:hypothetical protein
MSRKMGVLVLFAAAAAAQGVKEKAEVTEEFEVGLPAPPPGAPGHPMMLHRGGVVGGHTFEFISSEMGVPGSVVKGAPYSAEGVTETTQTLADGNRISRKNSTSMYRDSQGRTRREVTLNAIGPWAASANTPAKVVFIHDPVAGVSYSLNEKDKTAHKMEGKGMVVSYSSESKAGMPAGAVGGAVGVGFERQDRLIAAPAMAGIRVPSPDAKNAKTESLGKRNIEGVISEGTRTTWTIAAGEIGNDRPIEIVSERWYSPELQTIMMSRQADPRTGETLYKLSNLRRSEPAPQMFEVPADYTVVTEHIPKIMRKLRTEK